MIGFRTTGKEGLGLELLVELSLGLGWEVMVALSGDLGWEVMAEEGGSFEEVKEGAESDSESEESDSEEESLDDDDDNDDDDDDSEEPSELLSLPRLSLEGGLICGRGEGDGGRGSNGF